MSNKTKWARPVAFNYRNAEDVAMLEYLADRPFSTYIKELIKRDMRGMGQSVKVPSKGITINGHTRATTPPKTFYKQVQQR